MKRYKIKYFNRDRSEPSYLIQIFKSGKRDGISVRFWYDGKKVCQAKSKNGLLNGTDKHWDYSNTKNISYLNWKKETTQGIEIIFFIHSQPTLS